MQSYLVNDIPVLKTIERSNYYSIEIIINYKVKEYLCKKESDCKIWLKNLKRIIKHKKFSDKYKIDELINEGKFASVYKGYSIKRKEEACIKIIDKNKINRKSSVIYNEILIMKTLKHGNIVNYIEHFEDYDNIYIITEYLKGGQLINYLIDQTNLDDRRKVEIMSQIGRGIEYLQSMGVLHRDIKPGNIVVASKKENAVAKIIDFGLSTFIGEDDVLYKKCGTLYYMPPEIILEKAYNRNIDIWSLGMVFYYIIYGNLPFCEESNNDEDKTKRIEYICKKDIKAPDGCDLFKNLIAFCLKRNPYERENIKKIIEELENIKGK
jgi:serine/threonine protein kinase